MQAYTVIVKLYLFSLSIILLSTNYFTYEFIEYVQRHESILNSSFCWENWFILKPDIRKIKYTDGLA